MRPTDTMPSDPDQLPTSGVSDFVDRFARAHGIEYKRSGLDDWAEAITRLSGDDVQLDRTGKLLVALKRARLISGLQMARLLTNHLREIKRAPDLAR